MLVTCCSCGLATLALALLGLHFSCDGATLVLWRARCRGLNIGGHHIQFLDLGGNQKTRTGAAGRGNALLLDFGGMQQARSWAVGQQEVLGFTQEAPY